MTLSFLFTCLNSSCKAASILDIKKSGELLFCKRFPEGGNEDKRFFKLSLFPNKSIVCLKKDFLKIDLFCSF